jgi:hypothetical protein
MKVFGEAPARSSGSGVELTEAVYAPLETEGTQAPCQYAHIRLDPMDDDSRTPESEVKGVASLLA